jgi:hypothetical protein
LGPPCPEPEPEPGGTWPPGGRRWPPLLPLLPLDPEDELPAFGFWFGPVGNEPCVLLLLPPPRAIEPETGASRATPTVAVVTPSMMLSRLVIIVAPVAGDKYNYRSQLAAFCRRRPSRLWVDSALTASAYHTHGRALLFARSAIEPFAMHNARARGVGLAIHINVENREPQAREVARLGLQ